MSGAFKLVVFVLRAIFARAISLVECARGAHQYSSSSRILYYTTGISHVRGSKTIHVECALCDCVLYEFIRGTRDI